MRAELTASGSHAQEMRLMACELLEKLRAQHAPR
jgi:hypothetical protein